MQTLVSSLTVRRFLQEKVGIVDLLDARGIFRDGVIWQLLLERAFRFKCPRVSSRLGLSLADAVRRLLRDGVGAASDFGLPATIPENGLPGLSPTEAIHEGPPMSKAIKN